VPSRWPMPRACAWPRNCCAATFRIMATGHRAGGGSVGIGHDAHGGRGICHGAASGGPRPALGSGSERVSGFEILPP
jgi:hypothetical protein